MTALVIMACERRAPNWHSCIASALLAGFRGPIVVSYDGLLSSEEVAVYEHLPVSLCGVSSLGDAVSPKLRACLNACSAFRLASEFDSAVVVEDDVTFAKGWTYALAAAWDMSASDAVILGYCRGDMPPPRHGGETIDRDATWDATLFVGVSQRRAAEAAQALTANLALAEPLPADNALSLHWRESGTRRLTMNPSVVQHLGDVAVINPQDGIRRAPSFTGRA